MYLWNNGNCSGRSGLYIHWAKNSHHKIPRNPEGWEIYTTGKKYWIFVRTIETLVLNILICGNSPIPIANKYCYSNAKILRLKIPTTFKVSIITLWNYLYSVCIQSFVTGIKQNYPKISQRSKFRNLIGCQKFYCQLLNLCFITKCSNCSDLVSNANNLRTMTWVIRLSFWNVHTIGDHR